MKFIFTKSISKYYTHINPIKFICKCLDWLVENSAIIFLAQNHVVIFVHENSEKSINSLKSYKQSRIREIGIAWEHLYPEDVLNFSSRHYHISKMMLQRGLQGVTYDECYFRILPYLEKWISFWSTYDCIFIEIHMQRMYGGVNSFII